MDRPSTGPGRSEQDLLNCRNEVLRPVAPRHQLLLRLWILATVGLVGSIAAGALWWEKQLPGKLNEAARTGDLEACLRYGEQLAALRWLGQSAPEEQALCRRRQAEILWEDGKHEDALKLQRQLVKSSHGDSDRRLADKETLMAWQSELRDQALKLFRKGELEASIRKLAPLENSNSPGGTVLSDTLRETWNRNRITFERLQALVDDQRWWEALDSLNRLDHPWWQNRSEPNRRLIETAIRQLRDTQEHQPHGSTDPDVISGDELETTVQTHLQAGMDPWNAFQSGCADLGGRVIEDGPESFCRREAQNSP